MDGQNIIDRYYNSFIDIEKSLIEYKKIPVRFDTKFLYGDYDGLILRTHADKIRNLEKMGFNTESEMKDCIRDALLNEHTYPGASGDQYPPYRFSNSIGFFPLNDEEKLNEANNAYLSWKNNDENIQYEVFNRLIHQVNSCFYSKMKLFADNRLKYNKAKMVASKKGLPIEVEKKISSILGGEKKKTRKKFKKKSKRKSKKRSKRKTKRNLF